MITAMQPPPIVFRQATAEMAEAIHALLDPMARQGLLLPRSVEEIRAAVRTFTVALLDETIVGCVSLRDYGEGLVEIRSLAVLPDLSGRGLGSQLILEAVEKARHLGLQRVFALTRRPNLFVRKGFHTVSKERFPEKVWTDCAQCPIRDHCDEAAVLRLLDPIQTDGCTPLIPA